MRSHIALLRGINVGGNNLVRMADLRGFFLNLGLSDAQTLLQSGNVVFRAVGRTSEELETLLEEQAEEHLGIRITFMVRTSQEWNDLIAENPFPAEAESDPSHLLAVALKDEAPADGIVALQAAISGPERIAGSGRHLYVVYPDGMGPSKVSRTPGWNKLVGPGTARNWNTVLKIAAMTRS
ncbi:MAG: DUF1697 domain-containing protein [Fimbriimonadales bacterium]